MNDICIAFFVILAVGFRRSLNKLARVFKLDLSGRAVSGRLIGSTGIAMRSSRKCEAALRTRYPIIREQPESRSANYHEIADKLSGRRAGFVTFMFFNGYESSRRTRGNSD